jgi:hypothetical protein
VVGDAVITAVSVFIKERLFPSIVKCSPLQRACQLCWRWRSGLFMDGK